MINQPLWGLTGAEATTTEKNAILVSVAAGAGGCTPHHRHPFDERKDLLLLCSLRAGCVLAYSAFFRRSQGIQLRKRPPSSLVFLSVFNTTVVAKGLVVIVVGLYMCGCVGADDAACCDLRLLLLLVVSFLRTSVRTAVSLYQHTWRFCWV